MAGYGKNRDREGNPEYDQLRDDLKNGAPRRVYVFYGEERYLLEDAVRRLRAMIPEGTGEFNHHRLEGKDLDLNDLADAIDALPAFSERTLTEVTDCDLGRLGEGDRGRLTAMLSDVPDYATVVFIFDTVEYKLDGRTKANQELKKLFTAVEFTPQSERVLTSWTVKILASAGKRITRPAVQRLIAMTGGLMTGLRAELEKLISYTGGDAVDVADVEAVVVPVPEAAAWELTDALIAGKSDTALERLSELLKMNEAAHKLLYGVSLKLRQLLIARICLDARASRKEFMELAGLRFDFQARALLDAAARLTGEKCAAFCRMAADTAYRLNSSSRDEGELLADLAVRILAA